MTPKRKKLVLAVIDALKPEMLDRAIEHGRAPALARLIERTRARLKDGAAALLTAYADGVALLLAAIAIFLPPVSILAIAAFVVLLIRAQQGGDRKYEGLRILR